MIVFFEESIYGVTESDEIVEVCVLREGDVSQSLTIYVSTQEYAVSQAEGKLAF